MKGQKPDESLVSTADLEAEKLIIQRIKERYPEDLFLAEESGLSSSHREAGQHIWVIDPLDGTTNFLNGYPVYCISIGRGEVRKDNKIAIQQAAIYDPSRKKLYEASLGGGATCNGKPLRVKADQSLERAFLATGFYYAKGEVLEREIERFTKVALRCQNIRRDASAALDMALVAEGVYDAFWETGLQPWDVAAGSLLVTEAGGVVRNYTVDESGFFDIEQSSLISGSFAVANAVAGIVTT